MLPQPSASDLDLSLTSYPSLQMNLGQWGAAPSNPRFTAIHRGGAWNGCWATSSTRRRGLGEVRRCFRRDLNRPGELSSTGTVKWFKKIRHKVRGPLFFTLSPATNHSSVPLFFVSVFASGCAHVSHQSVSRWHEIHGGAAAAAHPWGAATALCLAHKESFVMKCMKSKAISLCCPNNVETQQQHC